MKDNCERKVRTEDFSFYYEKLPYNLQRIVSSTILEFIDKTTRRKFECDKKSNIDRYNLTELINDKKKELGITDKQICEEIKKNSGCEISIDVLRSIKKRNAHTSSHWNDIAKVLNISSLSQYPQYKIPNNTIDKSMQLHTAKLAFELLEVKEKKAMLHLVKSLYTLHTCPEAFDFSNEDLLDQDNYNDQNK